MNNNHKIILIHEDWKEIDKKVDELNELVKIAALKQIAPEKYLLEISIGGKSESETIKALLDRFDSISKVQNHFAHEVDALIRIHFPELTLEGTNE